MTDQWETVTPQRQLPKGVLVKVTREHFAKGVRLPFDWKTDPFAIAVRETLNVFSAMVGWGYASTYDNNIRKDYYIKPVIPLRESMQAWQQGREVPVEFEMFLDKEKDVTPKFSSRKPRRSKSWLQIEAERKINEKLDL